MKGTIKDLAMAEELATKGRYADAIKVVDRMMGIPAGAPPAERVEAMRAAILSDAPVMGENDSPLVERPDGTSELTFNPLRSKLGGEWAADILLLRFRWLVAFVDTERSQDAVVFSMGESHLLAELLSEPQVCARIKPDNQASLLATACDPFFLVNDYQVIRQLLQSAFFRAPTNTTALEIVRALVERLRLNLQKNAGPSPKREKYREGIALLEPLLFTAEVAQRVAAADPSLDAEAIKRKVIDSLVPPAPAAAPPVSPPEPAEKPGFWGRLFGKR